MMMNKKDSNKIALLKYAMILPLVVALIVSANAQTVVKKSAKVVKNAIQEQTEKAPVKSTVSFIPPIEKSQAEVKKIEPQAEPILQIAEKMPEYPGGTQALMSFITKTVRYPVAAMEAGVESNVLVRFVVNKEGKAVNAEVIKTIEMNAKKQGEVTVVGYAAKDTIPNAKYEDGLKALEKEGLRVISLMDNWVPGEQKGEKVSVYFVLPINFRLNGKSTKTENAQVTEKHFPLYYIDDKPSSEAEMKALDPKEIQEVNVLKDEVATKAYGEKGKYGVVLIKLKKK